MSTRPLPRCSGARKNHQYNFTSGLLEGVVETISPPILEGSEKDAVPEDLIYIGSYNWLNSPIPTIVVPGSPRIWADREMPMTVPIDSGKNFIDQNRHRMNRFTLLPLVRAVQDLTDQGDTERFNWPSVDFVTDRGRLRQLLAWAVGTPDVWRIDTQLAGANTILLSGWSEITKETSGRSYSHGFNFETASTYPISGLENESGHHRIIAYNFDELRMVVRFQVDACLPYDATPWRKTSYHRTSRKKVAKKGFPSGPTSNSLDVKTIRAGSSDVPQTHLVELKTRKITDKNRARFCWKKMYPQLYLAQTPHMHRAYHKNGTFTHVEKFTLGQGELMEVDKRAQDGFKKLRKLLGYIKPLVLKYGAARISLVCEGKTLSVYRIPQGESCLPEDALALFVA